MARDLEQEARNKALVLEAFDALFNRRDFEAAATYFSPTYIQHSAGIAPGRDGLFSLVRGLTRRYQSSLAVAEGDYVMVHGRFSGGGRPTRIDRKSTRLNSSHQIISYAVFCLKKKKKTPREL